MTILKIMKLGVFCNIFSYLFVSNGFAEELDDEKKLAIERLAKLDLLNSYPKGLVSKTENSQGGYTLISPTTSHDVLLIDINGEVVNKWKTGGRPGLSAYLLEDGSLIRATRIVSHSSEGNSQAGNKVESTFIRGGGLGGLIEQYNWAGDLIWKFRYANEEHFLHHDMEVMPNGNVLAIAWKLVSNSDAISAGCNPDNLDGAELWVNQLIEVKPIYPSGGEIVWSWNSWDHIIQEEFPEKPNYGIVAETPNKINLNYFNIPVRRQIIRKRDDPLVGEKNIAVRKKFANKFVDWLHVNSVDFNPKNNLIILSVHNFNEIWIIDKLKPELGIIYRFGNPDVFALKQKPQKEGIRLYHQHDARWVDMENKEGEFITLFNNGDRNKFPYSSAMAFELPKLEIAGENGDYPGYKMPKLLWRYPQNDTGRYFALRMSGVQKLRNGNYLVTHGPKGQCLEVDANGNIVWEYWNKYGKLGPENDDPRHAGSVRPVFKVMRYQKVDVDGETKWME